VVTLAPEQPGEGPSPTNLVAAHLLRVEDPLPLDHPGAGRPNGELEMPAVLIIPCGSGPNEPHLIVLTDPGRHQLPRPAGWISTDVHQVVSADFRRSCALIRPYGGIARMLGGPRGGDVVVCHKAQGCSLRLREGWLVAVDGPRIVPAAAGVSAYALYGSAVHCWQSAGIPVPALENAVVAVGRYVASTAGRPMRFLVTGRAELRIRRLRPMAAVLTRRIGR
jgi:hypothetical protein